MCLPSLQSLILNPHSSSPATWLPSSPDRSQLVYHARLHAVQPWRPLELVFSTPTAKMSSVIREDGVTDPSGRACQAPCDLHSWELSPIHRAWAASRCEPLSPGCSWLVYEQATGPCWAHHSLSQEVEIGTEVLIWAFDGRTLERGSLTSWCWSP